MYTYTKSNLFKNTIYFLKLFLSYKNLGWEGGSVIKFYKGQL